MNLLTRYVWPRGEILTTVGLVAVIATCAVVLPVPNTRFASATRDLASFLILAIIAFAVARALHLRGFRRGPSAALIVSGALILGLAVESLETVAGGGFSVRDLLMDTVAAAAGISAAEMLKPGSLVHFWGASASIFLAGAAWPFFLTTHSYFVRWTQFPVILDASVASNMDWVRPMDEPAQIVDIGPAFRREAGEKAILVPLEDGPRSGLAIDEPYGDWSAWSTLLVDVINPGDRPIRVLLNVDDMRGSGRLGDRYDRWLDLPPASRRIVRTRLQDIVRSIPHRRFALEDMDIVMLSAPGVMPGRRLLVRRIWLERDHN